MLFYSVKQKSSPWAAYYFLVQNRVQQFQFCIRSKLFRRHIIEFFNQSLKFLCSLLPFFFCNGLFNHFREWFEKYSLGSRLDDSVCHVLRHNVVAQEFHSECRTAFGHRAQVGGVAKHF